MVSIFFVSQCLVLCTPCYLLKKSLTISSHSTWSAISSVHKVKGTHWIVTMVLYTQEDMQYVWLILYTKTNLLFASGCFESRQEHNTFLTLCPQNTHSISVRLFIWLFRAFGSCINCLLPHLHKTLLLFFFLTKLLQNALRSKTLVFLSCLHLNISVIHPTMLLPNHISLSS